MYELLREVGFLPATLQRSQGQGHQELPSYLKSTSCRDSFSLGPHPLLRAYNGTSGRQQI